MDVPRKSVLRFIGHSLISNFEDGCVKSLWGKSIAGIRRGIVRIQNHVVMLFFTGVSSVQKPIDGSLARLILAPRASLDRPGFL